MDKPAFALMLAQHLQHAAGNESAPVWDSIKLYRATRIGLKAEAPSTLRSKGANAARPAARPERQRHRRGGQVRLLSEGRTIGKTTTNDNGYYRFARRPRNDITYQTLFKTNRSFKGTMSRKRTVRVR